MPLSVVLALCVASVLVLGVVCRRQRRQLVAAREESVRYWERGLTRFNETADLLPDILVEIDPSQVITFANRAFTTICGYTERDLRVGLTLADVLVPEQRPRLLRALAETQSEEVRGGEAGGGHQLLLRCRGGEVVPVILHLRPVVQAGRFAGWRGVLRDLREERRDDARPRLSRRAAEAVIRGIMKDFARTSAERWDDVTARAIASAGAYLGVDRAYLYREGSTGDQLRACHLWYAEGVTPLADDAAVPPLDAYPWVVENFARGHSLCVPDVSRMPAEAAVERQSWQAQGVSALIAVPWREGGEVRGLLGCEVFGDVRHWDERDLDVLEIIAEICAEQRAKAHDQFRFIGDVQPTAACVVDAAGTVVAWNRALATLTGVPAAAVIGVDVAAARIRVQGDGLDTWPLEKLLSSASAGGNPAATTVDLAGGGQPATWRLAAHGIPDRSGGCRGVVQTFQDVTADVAAVRASRRRTRDAERRLVAAREEIGRLHADLAARDYRLAVGGIATRAPSAAADR